MLCSEAIDRINRKLGYRTDKQDEILDELHDAQQEMEIGVPSPQGRSTFFPWFLISEVASALTTINEERVQLPTDFAGDVENFNLYYYNTDEDEPWIQLTKDDEIFNKMKIRDSDPNTIISGAPQAFTYSGGYWRIYPRPDQQYPLRLIFSAKDTVLTRTPDITNKWLTNAPWLLIAAAGLAMAQTLRDPGATTFFQGRLALAVLSLWTATESRFVTNDRPVMGGAF